MNNLRVHIGYLFLHLRDLFFSWANIPFEFFDLIIQHKLELLEFLGLLFELVDPGHFVSDCFFPLFDLLGLRLFLLNIFLVFLLYFFNVFMSMLQLMVLFFELSLMPVVTLFFCSFFTFCLFILLRQLFYNCLVFLFLQPNELLSFSLCLLPHFFIFFI